MGITEINKENYDKFPYKSKSFEQSNPFRQKLVMDYLGMQTKELENARVLEIGCSYGGNIIPFAVEYENSEVYGIDLSETQINVGKEIIAKMGLENIKLIQMNILDYNQEFGKFDYIICHGVFSWVPDIVKEKIISVIKESLNENGVAHISYNTYPGWKSLDIYKEACLFRRDFLKKEIPNLTPMDEVNLGRGIFEFIKENTKLSDIVRNKSDLIIKSEDHYIYHEYFEETNDPMYIYDFNEMLNEKGLSHIIDSNIRLSFIYNDYISLLDEECGNDFVAKEQYMDYINETQFRNSLITHIENIPKLKLANDITFAQFSKYYVRNKYGIDITEDTNDILKYINSKYPNYVKVEELFEKNFSKQEIIDLIINNQFEILYEKPNEIKYNKNLKLKERYRKYFEYFLNEKEPPIAIAMKRGVSVNISEEEIRTLLEFDGNKSLDDIYENLKNRYENKEIDVLGNWKNEPYKVLERHLNYIYEFIKHYEIFE